MRNFARRAISLLCVLSMLFSMVITSSAQQSGTTISVISQTIEQGSGTEEVEVPIKILNNTGILGMTVSVTFDDELTLVNAVKGEALSSLTFAKSKNLTDVPYNLVWDGEASADTNNGVIATLTFEVPKGTAKDYAINIEASGVYDDNVEPLYPTTVNGKITVEGKIDEPTSETTINVENQTIEQGTGTEDVEVPIKISNNSGILGMTVSVTFDDELTLVNAVKGDALNSLTFAKSKNFTDVPYNLVWDGEASADTNNGVIATLTFTVPKGTVKDYAINIEASGVYDDNVNPLYPTTINGKISVEAGQEEPSSDTTISVESQTVEQGTGNEDVEVPIKISNNSGILGMTVSVTFDDELTLVNAVKGDALSSLTFAKSKNFTDVPYNLVWDGEASADTNNGVIATLTFTVPKGSAKDYSINIAASGVYDDNVNPLYPTAVNGKISVSDNEHNHSYGDWVKDNDNTHSKTCECGDVVTEAHNWDDGEVTTPATHTTTGIKTYTCSECNGTKTEIIPADSDNHTFGEWEKVDDTNHSRECACGETETATHNWNDGEVTTPATHTATGIKTFTCEDCGATKTETIDKTPTHSHGVWTKVDDNTHSKTCECGDVVTEDHNWNDGEVTTEATHTKDGIKTYTCPDCSATKTETIPADADNHSFGAWAKVDDNNHKRECACGEIETKSHNWGEGTITKPATHTEYGVRTYTCPDCNATKTEQVNKTPDHSHGAWVKDNDNTHSKTCACGDVITENHNWNDGEVTTPATHTATGIKTFTCSECNGTKTEVIPADSDNHTFGEWEKVDDTNHSRECACGETETAAHTWDDGEITTPATHTTTGVKTFTCGDCGATKTETIEKTPTHSHGAWVKDNDNTHSKTCACGDVITEDHNWNDGEITTPVTHTTTGIKTYTCSECNGTKAEIIPADSDNHTFGDWEKVDDTNHSRECACGETETAAHTWNDGEVTTAATHTTTGVKTFTCGDCGATKTETIDKAPTHSHGAWTRVDDNTHSKSCACGDEITENHNWDAGVVTTQPTYSSTGIKTYTCPDCSATKTETIPVLTHVSSGRGGVTKYTVKYETNGGNVIKSVSVRRNSLLTKPTDPTKEGFEFDGWYIDENLTEIYDFTSKVTKGFTLYAKWTEIEKEPEIIEPDKEQDFVDVSEEDWFDNSVKYVVNNNLMNGVSDKEFAPNAAVTRAMLVTVLYRNEGEPATNKSIPFADVDMSTYYANAVSWAKQNGIVSGVSENTFAPDVNITREQIAAIMHRYAKYKGYDVSVGENTNILSYDDFDSISEYAIASMQYVVGSGLIKGKSETTLNPLDSATRAEIAAILQRFIEANK